MSGWQHDVAVIYASNSKSGCLPVPTVGQGFPVRINTTVENHGDSAETFYVSAYAINVTDSYLIGEQQVTLDSKARTGLTFTWNTSGYARGSYALSVRAETVASEVDTGDNSCGAGTVWVNIVGDVNGDNYVGIDDIFAIAVHFSEEPPHPYWNPNCDLNDDDYIGIDDIFTAAVHFGETEP
jgi:hypothetical protein